MDAVWRFQNKMFFLTSVVKSRPLDANIGDLIKSCYIVNSAVDPRKWSLSKKKKMGTAFGLLIDVDLVACFEKGGSSSVTCSRTGITCQGSSVCFGVRLEQKGYPEHQFQWSHGVHEGYGLNLQLISAPLWGYAEWWLWCEIHNRKLYFNGIVICDSIVATCNNYNYRNRIWCRMIEETGPVEPKQPLKW